MRQRGSTWRTLCQVKQTSHKYCIISPLCCWVAKSHPALCHPMGCSPPGPSVQEISQARILERVAICFSRVSSQHRNGTQVSCIAGSFFSFWVTGRPLHWLFGLFAYMTWGPISSSALALFWLAGMCYGLIYKDSISWLFFLKLAKQRLWKASHVQERQTWIFLLLQNVGWYL